MSDMMFGQVRVVREDKGLGYIEAENGDTIFFFLTAVQHNIIPPMGCEVQFFLKQAKKGPMATSITVLPPRKEPRKPSYTQEGFDALRQIADWKLDAKFDNNLRYFFVIPEIEAIENADKCYVIGRKGTGKTAISEYLSNKSSHDIFSCKLSFKNFPFNDLYALEDNSYTHPNTYITLWKYIIYSSIARLMILNQNIDSTIRSKLESIYSPDIGSSLPKNITRWTTRNIGFSVLATGVSIGHSTTTRPSDASWTDRIDVLEQLIATYLDESKYFVLFDELDEDYREVQDKEATTRYTSLLIGLFKAAQDIRSKFTQNNTGILPVIFLRDDIYALLMDSDKTKWSDFSINLSWDVNKIKLLLAFRISRAFNATSPPLEFDAAWKTIVSPRYIGIRAKRDSFDFVALHTLSRPRDYIQYLKSAATIAMTNELSIIDAPSLAHASHDYSSYLRSEFIDELYPIIPEISSVFDVLAQIGKQTFTTRDFSKAYLQSVRINQLPKRDPLELLEILFDFSVLGYVVPGSNRRIFKNNEPKAIFNPAYSVIIQYGLFNAFLLT